VVWDCSHAIGSIELDFEKNGVELAVGCTYKYGNSGPGSPAWLFVAKALQTKLRVPIQGWFAQDKQFEMGPFFEPADTIRRYQIASPSIIGIRAVEVAFEMIERAGISNIQQKAQLGTKLMVDLHKQWLEPLGFGLGSPEDPTKRGGHIILTHPDAKQIAGALRKFKKVVPDYREPNSLRLAISPLATSYQEVYEGFKRLRDLVASRDYMNFKDEGNRVT
jgi:kynureninase